MRKKSMFLPLGIVILMICNGCAASPAKVTIGKETYLSNPLFEPVKSNTTGEPELVFCADVSDENPFNYKPTLERFVKHAPFRQISLAESQSTCDVMLRLKWIYANGSGTVVATSAENGSELLRAEAEGKWGPVFGIERLGPIVFNAFVPGTPLYRQVTDSKKSKEAEFRESVRRYREMPVKPSLPEEARKYKVQAESAFNRKDFDEAAARYLDALKIAPWWPEGYFNRALIFGETGRYRKAVEEMRKYLVIVPDAPDARAAQDKIYEWEGLARKAGPQSVESGTSVGTSREPSRSK
ncbi:MAG TPA: tetratricopeptide repeat protein [Candidatus Deferrimicrobiaceae bacterium]|jgi:hypothetical protein